MTAPQPNPLELAKQGDVKAIAFLINRSLKPKGIAAKVALKDGLLQVMLESVQIPDKTLASFVHNGVTGLEAAPVRGLRVYGRKQGDSIPEWQAEFDIPEKILNDSVMSPAQVANKLLSESPTELASRAAEAIRDRKKTLPFRLFAIFKNKSLVSGE